MVNDTNVAFKVTDRSYFAIIKKDIHALAISSNFDAKKVGEIDIIIAEMVTNLVKHAGGGQILVKLLMENGLQGMEIISIDNGPGMTDVSRMVADGVSTKNTLGQGLGAIKRLSEVFQIYSLKDWGTVQLVRVFEKPLSLFIKPLKAELRSVILPKPGEVACGDGLYYVMNDRYIKILLGDGLGHGVQAAKAVMAAGKAFLGCHSADPVDVIGVINEAVKKTRGLVGTIAIFDLANKKWNICGVGNIITKVNGITTTKIYTNHNGIIGLNLPRTLNALEMEYEKGQHIIMCSDGLKSRWDSAKYPAISRYDLSILAAVLLKDFARYTDDMSVVACKINL